MNRLALIAALATALAFPATASARFGKRDSDDDDKKSSNRQSAPAQPSSSHQARPAPPSYPAPSHSGSEGHARPSGHQHYDRPAPGPTYHHDRGPARHHYDRRPSVVVAPLPPPLFPPVFVPPPVFIPPPVVVAPPVVVEAPVVVAPPAPVYVEPVVAPAPVPVYIEPAPVVAPAPVIVTPPVQYAAPVEAVPEHRRFTADLRIEGLAFATGGPSSATGGAGALRLYGEGEHFGVGAGFTGVLVPADDGSDAIDGIGLLDVNLAISVLSGERGRLRVEGGVAAAFAPDVTFVGFDLAVTSEVRILGPVGLAGGIRVVPFPYRAVDWNAALQLSLGDVDLRAGARQIWLDDAGLLDGTRHTDSFFGPWIGIGVRL